MGRLRLSEEYSGKLDPEELDLEELNAQAFSPEHLADLKRQEIQKPINIAGVLPIPRFNPPEKPAGGVADRVPAPKALPEDRVAGFADASGGLKALAEMTKGAAPVPDDGGANALRLQRLFDDAELGKAQKEDASRARALQFAKMLEGAAAKIGSRKADYSIYEDPDPNAKAKALMAQMEIARGRRKDASDESRAKAAADLQGKALARQESRDKADDEYRSAKEKREADEFRASLASKERIAAQDRAAQERLAGLKGGGKNGKELPATEVSKLAGLDTASSAMDELWTKWNAKTKDGGSLTQFLPGSKAKQYAEDDVKGTAQVVGLVLEDGKLTGEDYPKYVALMPQAGDSQARAQNKVNNIKRLIAIKKATGVNAFKAAGYDIGKADMNVPAPSGSGAAAPDYSAAEKWLQENPDHPKAAAIRARIGRK